jgi:hypothetical protein
MKNKNLFNMPKINGIQLLRSMTNTNFSGKAGREGWSREVLTPSAVTTLTFAIKA